MINGQPWGLFLAREEPEESFARRYFGDSCGQLYKPDYRSLNAENGDVDLRYTDDNPESYGKIFRNTKLDATSAGQGRLIEALKVLSSGEHLDSCAGYHAYMEFLLTEYIEGGQMEAVLEQAQENDCTLCGEGLHLLLFL